MTELLTWLEGSSLGVAMRGAGVWSYGVTNLVHILGVATLFGSVLVLDLRLLGAFARAPRRGRRTDGAACDGGLRDRGLSGSCLIVTNATEYIGNPLLLIKFPAIALGLVNALALGFVPAWRAARASSRRASGGAQVVRRSVACIVAHRARVRTADRAYW